jgi:hypothetical protein
MTWSITVLLKDFASVTALGGGLKMGGRRGWKLSMALDELFKNRRNVSQNSMRCQNEI